MPMDITALQAAARAIIFIPERYELVMEDNTPNGYDEKARTFIWEDPEHEDNRIEVSLSLGSGQLMRLQIERERDHVIEEIYPIEHAIEAAKRFMIQHHPDNEVLTYIHSKTKRNDYDIEFRAEVGGLPLPSSGCDIRLDPNLNIVHYKAELFLGEELPVWPAKIISAEAAKQRIVQDLHMQPIITILYPSVYDMEGDEDQHRLVYEPIQGRRNIDAITGEPLHSLQHDLLPPSVPIIQAEHGELNRENLHAINPILPPSHGLADASSDEDSSLIQFWEAQLGIDTERYVLDKPRGDDQNLILLYFDTSDINEDEEDRSATDPLSVDVYFERRWGTALRNLQAAFMIHIDKSTGSLEAYHQKQDSRNEEVRFTREQCWERAELFLRSFFPSYAKYLQLEVKWDGEDGGTDSEPGGDEGEAEPLDREFFHMPLYIDQYRVRLERVNISVSTITGEVLLYRGVSMKKIRELEAGKFEAVVSPESALARFVEQFDVSLKWFDYYDGNTVHYQLIYDPVCKRRVEVEGNHAEYVLDFIDAMSGELIWSKA
ncbi:YcdB/YcdC domain-containing protein [Paenibacillus sp. MDMC362]|uniref:YcdB/YcdC domain-containing protein n=1 Tax=Paenibacillus sp. MDMC362 TaxID=2977365 RepID=UPI000DC3FA48|nr:YcdB/YcdC domain-containing protein [Paenibacillus sp. MDMC362]RAR45851.1 DUF4901 domain-containing protein [Paenibacillus sp. MDMC362]